MCGPFPVDGEQGGGGAREENCYSTLGLKTRLASTLGAGAAPIQETPKRKEGERG